jgi:type VI secretion system protein ImpK
MTPDFSQAVDPVFEYLLHLFDRIERGDQVEAEPEQQRVRVALDLAKAKLGESEEWRHAEYALVCWVDEMLIRLTWPGREWWIGHPLERVLFSTADGAVFFFSRAKEAASTRDRNALEVYYICVILGFRGLYERSELEGWKKDYQLPESLQDWLRQAAEAIRLRRLPSIPPIGRMGPGAPPLAGRSWMVTSLVLAVLTGGIAFLAVVSWLLSKSA